MSCADTLLYIPTCKCNYFLQTNQTFDTFFAVFVTKYTFSVYNLNKKKEKTVTALC